ncbi:alpha/beta fold hydrolase [Burkholderia ubonensis]|uniref:alpha/beta fold hydrolase n=1 Tax=Burkholderia ubonensis TaxID=101571 RepID=UPI0018DF8CE2|nr:alpha/beta fold hydrolase [Burkholderia ubonensis]
MGDGGVPDFYTWNQVLPSQAGKLLRSESLTAKQSLASAGQNIRILYTSVNTLNHHATAVSGALFLPKGTPPRDGWPLLAWAHGTVGIADICAPSFAGRSPRDVAYLNHWLDQGYAVVATDYQGLGTPGPHPYFDYKATAYDLLDSIRAVQRGNFHVSKRVVLIGQSQGGGATLEAATNAKEYAPDLNIVGAVATGVSVPNAAGKMVEHTNEVKHVLAYFLMAMNTAPLINPKIVPEDYVSEKAIPAFRIAQTQCVAEIEHRIFVDHLTGANSFKKDVSPVVQALMQVRRYARLDTTIPIFWGIGGKDIDSPTEGQFELVRKACEVGDPVEWHLYPSFDHSATVIGSLPDSTVFVRNAFAGKPIVGNCATLPHLPPVL